MLKNEWRIGFVGIGRMGANMARRLHDHGYTLTAVYDIDQTKAVALAQELGCEAATTLPELSKGANTIITVVTDDEAMRTLFNPEAETNLLTYAKDCLFINCATVSPNIHSEIEELVEQRGGQSLEACMASSITQAREGTLYLMCGGKPEAFDQAKPLLESMSSAIRYVGESGHASRVKALVNMVMNMNTAALAEGLGLGEALGLDLTMLQEVFSQTGAASRVLETDGDDMINRDHECFFSAAHAAKDSGIALKLGEEEGLTLPLATATLQQYQRLVNRGKGEMDKSAVAELTFRDRVKG